MYVILMERVENLGLMGDVLTSQVETLRAQLSASPAQSSSGHRKKMAVRFEHQRVEHEARTIARRG